ncbi:HAMP domain-containing histidine kinase [Paenibacillus sp. SYP-B3998]|uniref:histidine kinase n=1 Tax=Paenibacillus sp. SYP-B3998 TaxID=2678564 RepID=A0A6G4A460_9BACL|nr:ATP-binding protein [Paenibacillus sp. SYP-B3998]NEW08599.1 HAMP domain-containing histidine kinase [Paenibacillus sp. SYP-B3998]
MRWNSIVTKLGATIMILFLVVLFIFSFVIDQIFAGFIHNKILKEADELSARYVSMMESHGDVMMDMMSELSNAGIYIMDNKGEVISSTGQLKEYESILATSSDLSTLASGQSLQKEVNFTSNKRYLVSAKPLRHEGAYMGSVFIFSSLDELDRSVTRARQFILLAGIGALLLAVGITYIISKRMSLPLIQIETVSRRMATGDLDARVKVESEDEIGSLSQAINDLATELQRYRANRSEFLANISHELRTPITYLEGYTQLLSEGLYDTEEEKKQYLDVLRQESVRLKHLIQDLFELSKMEEGKLNLDLEWIDLNEIVESCTEKVALKAKQKGISILSHVDQQLPMLYADGNRMEQVFLNLLDNAIRYSEKGEIMITIHQIQSELLIIIADTGMGIPKDEIAYIFERFYRVEKSRSREHGGTGLGLAIVKKLVETQGGSIRVNSTFGIGTQFHILFPRDKLAEQL